VTWVIRDDRLKATLLVRVDGNKGLHPVGAPVSLARRSCLDFLRISIVQLYSYGIKKDQIQLPEMSLEKYESDVYVVQKFGCGASGNILNADWRREADAKEKMLIGRRSWRLSSYN